MSKSPRPSGLVWRLALADLKHEWLLSLCMVLAIASIMTPLLVLFGLKFGTIETLRHRLLDDPKNLEIRPLTSRAYDQDWFDEVASWPEVAFVVPYTRQISASLDAYYPADPILAPLSLEVVPTGPGDPLLSARRLAAPKNGEAILSVMAAEALNVKVGDRLTLAAKRLSGSKIELGKIELLINGILPPEAAPGKSIMVPLAFLEQVEQFKDGRGVPELGWPGELAFGYPVFSSALVVTPEALGPELEFKMIRNTGFTSVNTIDSRAVTALTGLIVPPPGQYYLLNTKGEPAQAANLKTLAALFRGMEDISIFPMTDGLSITLNDPNSGHDVAFKLVPAAPFSTASDSPGYLLEKNEDAAVEKQWLAVYSGSWPQGPTTLTFKGKGGGLSLPVEVRGASEIVPGVAQTPLSLLGDLSLGHYRPLSYELESGRFLLTRRGYAGFRLYASTLENVPLLQKSFESQGLSVNTQAGRITEVLILDKYLNLVFWLIAAGAIIGGAASLLSNIYAGLERKRRELGVLRLLGLSGFAFIRFPLYSSLFLTLGGFLGSGLLFSALSAIINYLFRAQLRAGESLCRLSLHHILTAFGVALAISVLAGLMAARRAGRIEPAEALRDE